MFLWTTSRTVHKKGWSLLNPSPPKKSLLSPPVWLCLGSEMPAFMNTNFPFRSIHQHIKLHYMSVTFVVVDVTKCLQFGIFYRLTAYHLFEQKFKTLGLIHP